MRPLPYFYVLFSPPPLFFGFSRIAGPPVRAPPDTRLCGVCALRSSIYGENGSSTRRDISRDRRDTKPSRPKRVSDDAFESNPGQRRIEQSCATLRNSFFQG